MEKNIYTAFKFIIFCKKKILPFKFYLNRINQFCLKTFAIKSKKKKTGKKKSY